jgi:amino acid adenylation domain-containing protein
MLEDSQAPLLLTEKSLLNSLPPHAGEALCLDGDAAGWAQESGANPKSNVTGEDLLYVIFTSGSTGKPKGVQVQHRAVVNLLTFMARELHMGERDVVPALASFAFDMCIPELYLALVTGGRVVIGQRDLAANGGQLAALLRQTGATLVHATPTTWSLLLEAGFTGKGLKRVIGAEPLSAELCTRLLDADLSLYNFYGPTETTVWSTFHQFRSKAEPLTVGRPLANTQVYILDKNLHPVPIGVPGEIHIGGDGVACGYLKRPQLTAEKFVADPFSAKAHAKLYKTGDVGRYFPDGRVEFLGRIDTQVKLRGYRIELGEIEAALTKHPSLQAAAVVVREDTIGDKRLVAYVIPVPEQYSTASELRAYLKQSLPEYMVPSAFTVLDKFPLTPNGKLDRHALPAPDVARQAPVMSPRDEVESMLLEIWRKVLNVQRIGVQDSFFELGGHSLLAVRLMTEIEKATGKPIPLATLFQEDTVEHLAEIIRRETRPPHQIVSMIQPGNSRPAFFAIVTPGANPLGYVALARHLAQDQPFYSIQGPGPRLTGRPYSSAEFLNLANRYIEAMRTIQPHGPYYLGGMCEGARIAFDMARVLDARGEDVALLAIFDTWVIENTQIRFLWKIDYYRGRFKDFWRASLPEKRKTILKWLRDRVDHRVSGNNRSRSEWPAAYWPGASFVPPTFGGGITLLKRPKQPFYYVNDPQMGWGARTTGNVELQVIDVNTKKHILLLREPYVSQLAEKLMESLRSACERNSNNMSATAASR